MRRRRLWQAVGRARACLRAGGVYPQGPGGPVRATPNPWRAEHPRRWYTTTPKPPERASENHTSGSDLGEEEPCGSADNVFEQNSLTTTSSRSPPSRIPARCWTSSCSSSPAVLAWTEDLHGEGCGRQSRSSPPTAVLLRPEVSVHLVTRAAYRQRR